WIEPMTVATAPLSYFSTRRGALGRVAAFVALVAGLAIGPACAEEIPARYKGSGGVVRLPTNENATQVWHLAAMRKYQLDKKYGFQLQIVPSATTQMTVNAIQSG